MALTDSISKFNLGDVIAPYKAISVAGPADNQDLLDFFRMMTMDTQDFSLRYDRGDDFFAFPKEQSERNTILIIKDEAGKIKGCANIAVIPHLLNGKKILCAYLGDLRISPTLSARIRLQWKKFYTDLLLHFPHLEEFKDVEYLYSAILDENKNATRSLLKNDGEIIYHPVSSYETFNVIRPWPHALFAKNSFQAKKIDDNDAFQFLSTTSRSSGLHQFIDGTENCELKRKMKLWNDHPEFIGAYDSEGHLVAVCLPRKSTTKKLIVEKMSFRQKILSLFLPLINVPAFREKKPIETLYLTHLTFAEGVSPDEIKAALTALLLELFRERHSVHCLSFFTWPQWKLENMPFFVDKTRATFYQVMNRKQFDEHHFLKVEQKPPAFEIGIA